MSDSSSAWRFSSNQSNTNPPHPEVKLEDTMANDPWSIWRPELSKETHVSVLPPNPIPQTSPPAELPRQGLSIPMILEYTKGEGSIRLEISGREVLVPLDKKTGMNEAQKKRHRNAEASARSRKKRARNMEIMKKLEEARRVSKEKDEKLREKDEENQILRGKLAKNLEDEELREKDEELREIKEETQTIEPEIAKKLELLEDEELEKKHLAQLEDEAVPEEMSYAPDATLLGATYDPIFNPFLTPDYYLTGDHCATDPTELYWDCIQSLYTQYE
ncbi:hypothetical protein E4U13_000125 [Claviceps humidiphila]|uniref:BZIP domain-containing protein n=1 Tax=Claviceps humidiphila TaxID=1294629 RepID=A0A9P7TY54_9HYPO|nr:hypothetical protein E4U13_000125 [Claviceps humidiphila]